MTRTRIARIRRRWLAPLLLAAIALAAQGCAVQAYQRERLTDRIMAFETEARKDARRTKSFDAREGSTGGHGGAGGGCACN